MLYDRPFLVMQLDCTAQLLMCREYRGALGDVWTEQAEQESYDHLDAVRHRSE